jgi:hypothetical protein
MYGWTFDEIASMTIDQQILAIGGDEADPDDNRMTFRTQKEFEQWLANKSK